MRTNVRMVLGLALVLGVLTAACDNNPLKANRDKGAFIYTNPSFATLVVGGTAKIRANVMNQYSSPTGDAVTATPCDSKISAVVDTSLTPFDTPSRFVVTALAPGRSCLIVAGGGVTDTVQILNGPTSVKLVADATLASGQTKPLSVVFPNGTGPAFTGLGISDVTFTSKDPTIVFIDPVANTMSGRAPGSTYVVATLRGDRGPVVKDSVLVTVAAGPFSGTAPTTIARGSLITLTAGTIPFTPTTTVTINGNAVYVQSNSPTAITFVAPDIPGTTAAVIVANQGPNNIASSFTVPLTAEAGEPDSQAAPRPMTLGSTVYGTVSPTDPDDFYSIPITAGQVVTIDADWFPGTAATADIDVIVYKPSGAAQSFACATGAKPEHCVITIATAGTYVFNVEFYTAAGPLAYKLTVK